MSNRTNPSGSAWGFSRREFLGGCAAGLAGISALSSAQAQMLNTKPGPKTKIRLFFTHESPKKATWPNIGYDYEGRKTELLAKLKKACPGIEFTPTTITRDQAKEKIQQILASDKDKDIDGYIVYMVGIWVKALRSVAEAGLPTIFVDDLYAGSGEFLTEYARAKRKGLKVIGVSSSNFDDVAEAVHCFECINQLRHSNILEVGAGPGYWAYVDHKLIEQTLGPRVVPIDFAQLDHAYSAVDQAQANKWAQKWIKDSSKVVEPSQKEITKSGAMYLAIVDLMQQQKAQAIAINCLGGFYGGKMKAYPCLGFFQLNNDGYVGACEADMCSTLTMLIMAYLVNRPGYISDPVIDTSKNQIIYAHCVAPNKVFGSTGPANPYHIRSHSEDRKGAAIRSLMPLGEMTTSIKFDPRKMQVIFHQAKSVENVDEDKACRTKLAAEVVGDIDKLLTYWDQWSWHRVTFYGDLKRPVYNIAALLGFEVLEEA